MLLALLTALICSLPQTPPAKPAPKAGSSSKPAVPAKPRRTTDPAPRPLAPIPANSPESLAPADSIALVRVASTAELARVTEPWVQAGVLDPWVKDIATVLDHVVVPRGPWSLVDTSRPFAVAIRPGDASTRYVVILQCTDPARMIADETLRSAGWSAVVTGNYVSLARGPAVPTMDASSLLLLGVGRPESPDAVVRVFVQAALAQRDGKLRALVNELTGLDSTAGILDPEGGLVRSVLESVETLDVRIAAPRGSARIEVESRALPKADAAAVAKLDATDLEKVARVIDPAAEIQAVGLCDMASWLERAAAVCRPALDRYETTDPGRKDLEAFIGEALHAANLCSNMGPLMGFSLRSERSGLQVCMAGSPADPRACIDQLVEFARSIVGLKIVVPSSPANVDGLDVSRFRVDPDVDRALAELHASARDLASMKQGIDESWHALFGAQGCLVTSAVSGTVLVTTIGPDAALKGALARVSDPDAGAAAKSMTQALTILNPGFALQFDPARVLDHVDTLSTTSHVQLPPAPRTGTRLDRIARRLRGIAPVFVAGGVQGRIHALVVVADVARIGAAIRGPSPAMLTLRKKVMDDLQVLVDSVGAYTENNGGPPANLEAMAKPDAKGLTYFLDDKVPLDPWGRAYLYDVPPKRGAPPHLFTLGADGKVGGTGADADLDLARLKDDDL